MSVCTPTCTPTCFRVCICTSPTPQNVYTHTCISHVACLVAFDNAQQVGSKKQSLDHVETPVFESPPTLGCVAAFSTSKALLTSWMIKSIPVDIQSHCCRVSLTALAGFENGMVAESVAVGQAHRLVRRCSPLGIGGRICTGAQIASARKTWFSVVRCSSR